MKYFKRFLIVLLLIILIGFLMPQRFFMPVKGTNKSSYHPNSFWFYPWGKSVTHKGVDIFVKQGTEVVSSTDGLVVYTGEIKMGGKVVLILGPKWRLHYYAHLDEIKTSLFSWTNAEETIGTVGATGNAKGKPPHLHYSIVTLFPYPWRIDADRQGWKKMFFLNPIDYIDR